MKRLNQNLLDYIIENGYSLDNASEFLKNMSSFDDFKNLPVGESISSFSLPFGPVATDFTYAELYSYPALNITSTLIYFQYQGTDASVWNTVENIAPADSNLPVAVLNIDKVNRRVTVTSIGYSAGFIIRDLSNKVVVEVPAAEGFGSGYGLNAVIGNNVLHNILSISTYNYADHFTITNSVLSTIWVNNIPRYTDPYATGYSVETLGANLVNNGNCSTFPDIAGVSQSVNLTASIENNQLKLTSDGNVSPVNNTHMHLLGGTFATGAYTFNILPNFYKVTAKLVSKVGTFNANRPRFFIGGQTAFFGYTLTLSDNEVGVIYNRTTQNTYFRIDQPATGPATTIFDDFGVYPVTNQLFFGVKRPPHKTLVGKDASNFPLTN